MPTTNARLAETTAIPEPPCPSSRPVGPHLRAHGGSFHYVRVHDPGSVRAVVSHPRVTRQEEKQMTMTAFKHSDAESPEEPALVQQGDVVMPFYVVFDISYSMKPLTDELNAAGQGLQQDILDHPEVSDIVRVGLLTF